MCSSAQAPRVCATLPSPPWAQLPGPMSSGGAAAARRPGGADRCGSHRHAGEEVAPSPLPVAVLGAELAQRGQGPLMGICWQPLGQVPLLRGSLCLRMTAVMASAHLGIPFPGATALVCPALGDSGGLALVTFHRGRPAGMS